MKKPDTSNPATNWPVRCPACGFVESDEAWLDGDYDEFEVLGCCEGCVMCSRCTTEFDPLTGVRHDGCEECAWLNATVRKTTLF